MTKTHWREIKQTEYLGGHDLFDDDGASTEIYALTQRAALKN